MTKKEIKEFLSNFVKSKEWRKIREALLWKLDSPYWLIDDEGSFVYTVKQNRRYCQLIKDTEKGAKWCQAHFKGVLEEVKKTKGPFVTKCFANFLGFITPMVVEDEIIGAIGDCQIVDSELPFPIYKEITNKLGIDYNEFIASINEREAIPRKLLEIELGLIHLLCQSSINTVSMELEIHSQKILSQNIVRFYRLLEESRALMVGVDGVKLYDLIINIASESICAEIVSLMIIDPKTRVLTIQAQKGLSEGVVANTQQKIGEGVAGYVALTGSPLLVKDITKDSRFKRKEVYHTRYYTGSLISCPIKIKGEVIGVLNMNNERSARAFTEEDLNLLCIIAEHAALALEAQRVYQVERRREWLKSKTLQEQQTELKIQTEKLKLETERLRKELGKQALWKEEAAKLQVEAKKIEELQREAEWLREEAKKAKDVAEAEKLKAAATELTIQAEDSAMFKETELLKRQMEIYKNQIENLRTQEKDLSNKIKEAQELLLQAEEVKGLREETHLLQKQLNLMKEEEKKLKLQIQEIETYRDRAQEAEELRSKTQELAVLYDVSKSIVSIQNPREILPWVLERIRPLLDYQWGAYLFLDDGELYGEVVSLDVASESFFERLKKRMLNAWADLGPEREVPEKFEINVKGLPPRPGDGGELETVWISSPIVCRNRTTGLLYVGSTSKTPFEELAQRILPIAASHASVSIENLRTLEEAREAAIHDDLTKIFNFRHFGAFFPKEFKIAKRYNRPLSLMVIDFDHLKKFNDTYGHAEGNKLIRAIAQLISKNIREADYLARFGGDEFIILLSETAGAHAKELAEKILDNIRSYKYLIDNKTSHQLTVSIGVASLPEVEAKRPMELFMRADEALYRAKRLGRDRICLYEAS